MNYKSVFDKVLQEIKITYLYQITHYKIRFQMKGLIPFPSS